MRPIFTKFEAKLIRIEASLQECQDALDLEFFKNQLLNPTIHNYNEQLRLSNKTVEEQEAYHRITTKLNLLKANYLEKKKLLTEKENSTYLIGKNFILGPHGLVDELPKAKIDRNPPLPQKAIKAIEEKDKVSLLQFLYEFCEEKFAMKEAPGFVSLKMIDALWDMGTRGQELADLLKKALPDYNKPGNQLSEARYIALKNTTALIYQKFWHSGDSSIERYALDGFDRQYLSGFNEKNFSFTRPNPLLSRKSIPSKISENESLLFNRRGHLRKIISDAILDPKAEDSRMTPTVYVTNKEVWADESSQSQEMRCFGTQGRFWKRWQKCKEEDEVVAETENGDIPRARMLTERHGPGW